MSHARAVSARHGERGSTSTHGQWKHMCIYAVRRAAKGLASARMKGDAGVQRVGEGG